MADTRNFTDPVGARIAEARTQNAREALGGSSEFIDDNSSWLIADAQIGTLDAESGSELMGE